MLKESFAGRFSETRRMTFAPAAPPLLLLHGAADRTVRPEQSERMAARLRGAGGRARLRVFPGVGHIGILSAMAVPVRALGLAGAPVLEEVTGFVVAAA